MNTIIKDPVKGQGSPEKLYDLSLIEKMCRGNKEEIRKATSIFIKEAGDAIVTIRLAYEQQDWEKMREAAHRIKPVFGYYAVKDIVNDVQKLEMVLEEEDSLPGLGLTIGKMEGIIGEVIEQMKQDLNSKS